MKHNCVRADDYIADRNHASGGLKAAVSHAVESGCQYVLLGRGTYILDEYETIHTASIAHDDGCGDIDEKDCFLYLSGADGLTIKGECGEDGEPATELAGLHGPGSGIPRENGTGGVPGKLMPSVIWAQECGGLTLENLTISRRPETASAGRVEMVSRDAVEVKVFPGLPCYDGMAACCMNRFNVDERRLMGESLTFGFGFDKRFTRTGGRTLRLEDAGIAGKAKEGEGLSWHQSGRTDFILFFGGCDDLRLSNVRISNTNGFALLTENCRNIRARRLVIKPDGFQFFTGPRDGWKIYRCSGSVTLDGCHVEGVRMDGQNVHSNFLLVEQRSGDHELVCTCKYAPVPLRLPSSIGIYQGRDRYEFRLEAWEFAGGYEESSARAEEQTACAPVEGSINHVTRYRLRMKDALPDFVLPGSLIHALCWEPDSYECRDSVFKNIAGAGHLLRCRNVTIRGCRYENIMNAGILIGAELDTHCEGGHGENIVIEDCDFINCGFKPRYGPYGMGGIAVKSQGFSGPFNRNITVAGCRFKACAQGIELRDTGHALMTDLQFTDVERPFVIDEKTTEDIHVGRVQIHKADVI